MRNADAELFKDKIEVSLDGRQIFYLFFGGAVIASLVFVLGVMVGKRLESRSHIAQNAETSATLDPLAALDKLGDEERAEQLEFPKALMRPEAPRPDFAVQVQEIEEDEPEPAVEPEPRAAKPPAPEPEPEPVAEPEPEPEPEPPQAEAPEAETPEPAAAEPARTPKFTLQLSSFQDRAEAEAFHAELAAAGYEPYIKEADVPHKGRWYRVRLGKYLTHGDALAAKAEFEKRQKIIAYVTRL